MNLNYWPWNFFRLKFLSLARQRGGPNSAPSSFTNQLCALGKALNLSEPQYSHL